MTDLTACLEKLEELEKAATPGPWAAMFAFGSSDLPCEIIKETGRTQEVAGVVVPDDEHICEVHSDAKNPNHDFRFIAESRTAIPMLLRLVKRYREALDNIDKCLTVPAAEYVPAISDAFTIIDEIKRYEQREE